MSRLSPPTLYTVGKTITPSTPSIIFLLQKKCHSMKNNLLYIAQVFFKKNLILAIITTLGRGGGGLQARWFSSEIGTQMIFCVQNDFPNPPQKRYPEDNHVMKKDPDRLKQSIPYNFHEKIGLMLPLPRVTRFGAKMITF